MTSWVPTGLALSLAGLSGCFSTLNELEGPCEEGPMAHLVASDPGTARYTDSAAATISLADRTMLVGFTTNRGGPGAAEPSWAATMSVTEMGAWVPACQLDAPERGLAPDPSAVGGWMPIEDRLSFSENAPSGGLIAAAFRRHYLGSGDPLLAPSDEIRASFVSPSGCPSSTSEGRNVLTVTDPDDTRSFAHPSVVALGKDVFAVVWLSLARDARTFDDRVQGRLVKPLAPHFPGNATSVEGVTMNLDIPDRWVGTPVAIGLPEGLPGNPRIAVLWHSQSDSRGTTWLTLFDEHLARVADPLPLALDEDRDDAVTKRRIAAAIDARTGTLFAAWVTAGQGMTTKILGVRVHLGVRLSLDQTTDLSRPEEGSAWSPTVATLKDGFVAMWRSDTGLQAVVLDRQLRRRFVRQSCGTTAMRFANGLVGEPSVPSLTVRDDDTLVASWTQAVGPEGGDQSWSLAVRALRRGEVFP